MSDTIDYIDDYFTGALSESERREFETRCTNDEVFAGEVAFYISARQSVRDVLLEQKREVWSGGEALPVQTMPVARRVKKASVLKWVSYAAAACIIFIVAGYYLFYQPTPKRLAEEYINSLSLDHTMDASHDSLQAGIDAFNEGQYKDALSFFNGLRMRDKANTDAQEYAGMCYQKLNDYDKALECFRELSSITGLQSNRGDILQATTLLLRNGTGDDRKARQLLEKVVREDEEGSQEAKGMLEHW